MADVHQSQEFHTSTNIAKEAEPTIGAVSAIATASMGSNVLEPGPSPSSSCSLNPFMVHMNVNEISQPKPPIKRVDKRRKCVDDWADRYGEEFVVSTIQRSDAAGGVERVLVCRFCKQKVTPRSDRVKEHLSSKKHNHNKEIANAHITVATNVSKKLQEVVVSTAASSKRAPRKPAQHHHENPQHVLLPKIQMLDAETANASFHAAGGTLRSVGHENNFQGEKQVSIALEPPIGIAKRLLKHYLTGQFSDVTLMCDGSMIKCHKLILASFSAYFKEVLVEPQMSNAVICLSCVRLAELKACLELMYSGEVNIHSDQLPQLLVAMDRLGIKSIIKDSPQACVDFAKLWSAISSGTGNGGQLPIPNSTLHLQQSKGACKNGRDQGKKWPPQQVPILKPVLPEADQEVQIVRRKATKPRKLVRKCQPTEQSNYFKRMDGLNPLDVVQATFSDDENGHSESGNGSETNLKIDEDARP